MLSFHMIVVPTDFSPHSLRALDYAVGIAQVFDAEIKLVYVNEPVPRISDMAWQGAVLTDSDQERVDKATRGVEQIARERVPADVRFSIEVANGQAASKIIECAARENADLIIMATHGRTGLAHALMGSTTETVIRKAHCPVLALKQPLTVSTAKHQAAGE